MGQKIHPIGFRIGVIRDWESKWFAEKTYAELLYEDYQIRRYLQRRLSGASLSHVEIERQANKVKITLYTGKPALGAKTRRNKATDKYIIRKRTK